MAGLLVSQAEKTIASQRGYGKYDGDSQTSLVSIRKRSFSPMAALLSCRKMLTYPGTLRFFGAPRALPAKKNPRFRMETSLEGLNDEWQVRR